MDDKKLKKLDEFNNNEKKYKYISMVDAFDNKVKKFPDKIALVYDDKKFTYKEVDNLSNKIANYLLEKGISKGDIVSILSPRSEYMVIATLGVIKTGAAYQPLDSSYPESRLMFMIKDSGAKLVITEKNLQNIIPDYDGKIFYLDDIGSLKNSNQVKVEISEDSLLNLLYTSGSTGTPKGVMINHGNICAYTSFYNEKYELNENSVYASYASYGFDAFMMDMYVTLFAGAQLHIIKEDIRLDLFAIEDYFNKNHITHTFMTTQVGRQFHLSCNPKDLKYLLTGGEALISVENNKPYKLVNIYGPTETSVAVTSYFVSDYEEKPPIGTPNNNVKLYVVDKDGNRANIGEQGELWIAGPQVSVGYFNQKEKTDEVFIANPFSNDPNYLRVYKTGDIVYYAEDGNIHFVGRNDGQVKIHGFRIELQEIESAVIAFEGVNNVTVQAIDDDGGNKHLVAYVVCNDSVDFDKLKKSIENSKPYYMVPQYFVRLDSIPLNKNQKVDKAALPKPQIEEESEPTEAQHDNIIVQRIKKVLTEITGAKSFRNSLDLQNYGLDSISIVRLSVELTNEFNIDFNLDIFQGECSINTIEDYILEQYVSGSTKKTAHKDNEIGTLDEYGITKTQEGIYLESIANENTCIYNIPILLKLDKNIDCEKLKDAIVAAVNAHPYLNTRLYLNADNKISQYLDEEQFNEKQIEIIKCENIDEVKDNLIEAFDLLNDKLYRFKLIDCADGSLYFFLDVHHIIFDGTSRTILLNDISQAYAGENIAKEEYNGMDAYYVENKRRHSKDYVDAKKYYYDTFEDCDVDCLPVADILVEGVDSTSKELHVKGDKFKLTDINEYCKQHNVSLNAYFTSVYGFVLGKYTNKENPVFCTIYHGRNDLRFERSISMFVKTYPVISQLGNIKTSEYISQVSKQLLNNMRYDAFSFAEISNQLGIKAEQLFVFQNTLEDDTKFCGSQLEETLMKTDKARAAIEFHVFPDGDSVRYHIIYDPSKFSQDFMKAYISAFDCAAANFLIAENIHDVSLLDEVSTTVLDSFNDTAQDYEQTNVVERFCSIAKKYPDNIAVVFKDVKITYSELDKITNKIANYLNDKDIGSSDVVSVLIHRSQFMPICALGVLKSGAAYQPLDPGYPKDRLQYMVNDASAKMIILDDDLEDLISDCKVNLLYTKEIETLQKENAPDVNIDFDDLFILLYTSGSTGTPKGVMLTHRNFAVFSSWYGPSINLNPESRVAAYASFGFDVCTLDMFPTLTHGARLYIIAEDIRLDLYAIEQYFNEEKITNSFMTTQVARQFYDGFNPKYLQTLSCGGERLVAIEPKRDFKFINVYGPTEATVLTTIYEVDKLYTRIPIGPPIPNSKLYIADKYGTRLPVGAVGEIWISGHHVSKGYLNLPDKTNEVYIKNPFCDEDLYSRVYRSGDIARYLPSGDIDFIGRDDGQVKIRGFRIELSEIEACIRDFPDIDDATVHAFDEPSGGKYISAYIVCKKEFDEQKLREFIGSKKPSYMIPKNIIQIDEIPLTQNHKVDKKALPKTAPKKQEIDKKNIKMDLKQSDDDVEQAICDVFAKTLGLDAVDPESDFFELGGSSLQVMQVIVELGNMDYKVSYSDVFSNPTPKALRTFLKSTSGPELNPFGSISDYDYSNINKVLENNNIESYENGEAQELGDVVLAGSTGFLGIHVLNELLTSYDSKVYCLIRNSKGMSAKDKLSSMYFYYFDKNIFAEYKDRVKILNGDITSMESFDSLPTIEANTFINCAANVKHFSSGTDIEDVNYYAVKNIIAYCKDKNMRLIHVSTVSSAGENVDNMTSVEYYNEQMLYINQALTSKYSSSKYLAERDILEEVAKGFNAKIMRVGNLSARASDGEFQINFKTNSAVGRIKAVYVVGAYDYKSMSDTIEFTAIDKCAKAILILANTPKDCVVFHPYNNHNHLMEDVFTAMHDLGFDLDVVDTKTYNKMLEETKNDPEKSKILSSFIAYDRADGRDSYEIPPSNSYTMEILYRNNFRWPVTSIEYMKKFLKALNELDYFE